MQYLIGLDIGTSSVKGVLMTTDGKVVKKAHEGFNYTTRENNVVEIPAEDFLEACLDAIKTLASASDGEVLSICASSASGNLVVIGKEGKASTPIINWQDKRVTTEAKELLGEMDTTAFYKQIGWPFGYNAFPLAQLCYIKKHNPEIIENSSMVAMSTEYLYYALTGKWGIVKSAGTPFYLIDQVTGKYNSEILAKLGIDEEKLPPVMKTGSVLGTITKEAAEKCGLPVGTPVIIGTFDHPSAARGVGITKEGQMLLSCGTSWVGFYPVEKREKAISAKMLVDPFLSENGGAWAGMVSLTSFSQQIEYFTKTYVDNSDIWYIKLVEYSAESQTGAGGLILDMTAEPDDAEIRKYEKKHIARAIMENVIDMLAKGMKRITDAGIICNEAVMVGGPSENPLWAELIAEKLGISVCVKHGSYAGAVGAAALAGTAVGIYPDEKTASEILTTEN